MFDNIVGLAHRKAAVQKKGRLPGKQAMGRPGAMYQAGEGNKWGPCYCDATWPALLCCWLKHQWPYLPGTGAGREYRSMMVLMPSWHTEQNVS
ncbi:MAG: hypothetical protein RSE46_25820, partial [Janthinobacterium sp.]